MDGAKLKFGEFEQMSTLIIFKGGINRKRQRERKGEGERDCQAEIDKRRQIR